MVYIFSIFLFLTTLSASGDPNEYLARVKTTSADMEAIQDRIGSLSDFNAMLTAVDTVGLSGSNLGPVSVPTAIASGDALHTLQAQLDICLAILYRRLRFQLPAATGLHGGAADVARPIEDASLAEIQGILGAGWTAETAGVVNAGTKNAATINATNDTFESSASLAQIIQLLLALQT